MHNLCFFVLPILQQFHSNQCQSLATSCIWAEDMVKIIINKKYFNVSMLSSTWIKDASYYVPSISGMWMRMWNLELHSFTNAMTYTCTTSTYFILFLENCSKKESKFPVRSYSIQKKIRGFGGILLNWAQ